MTWKQKAIFLKKHGTLNRCGYAKFYRIRKSQNNFEFELEPENSWSETDKLTESVSYDLHLDTR